MKATTGVAPCGAAEDLRGSYLGALTEFLANRGKEAQGQAYDLGRQAMLRGLGILAVATLHNEALEEVVRSQQFTATKLRALRGAHTVFLLEALGPFEMAYSGYQDANAALRQLNKTLEQRVRQQTKALRQSEARFRSMIEHSTDVIVVLEADGTFRYASPGARRLLGYHPDLLVGKRVYEFVHPDDLARVEETFYTGTRTPGVGPPVEFRFRHQDGSWHVIESTYNNRLSDRSVRGIVVNTRDVTERKQAQADLARSEATLRGLLDAITEGLVAVDDEGRIAFVNPAMEAMFGYSHGDLVGRSVEILMPERLRKNHVSSRLDFREEPTARPMGHGRDLFARRKDGSRFPVEIGLSVVHGQEAPLTLAVVTDITVRKAAEEALRRYAERLNVLHELDRLILSAGTAEATARRAARRMRNLVPCERAAILLFDESRAEAEILAADGVAVDAVPPGTRLPIAETVGPLTEFRKGKTVAVADLSAVPQQTRLVQAMEANGLRSYMALPLRIRNKLIGCLTAWSSRVDAFSEEHIEIARSMAAQIAIAIEHRRLLEQVREYAAGLEERVAQRTAELQETNQEMEAFTYSVSHDLRAPLRAMRGYGQALLEDYGERLDPVAKSFMERIVEGASHMDTIILDLLDYSRLTRAQLDLEPVSTRAAVSAALAQLEAELEARRAQVTVSLADGTVRAHGPTLVQSIANLIANGIKFVAPGVKPRVRVRSERGEGVIRLIVEDNGIGIAQEHRDRVFRIFERLHNMEKYPGTGIGLAIVRKGIERMGGRVGLESQPGKGSRFWIELPATEGD